MRRFIGAALLVLAVGVAAAAGPFDRGPYSGAPAADSIVICWTGSPPMAGKLEIGPASTFAKSATFERTIEVAVPTSDRTGTEVRVDGLASATAYVYRATVQSGSETYASPVGHFRTAPAAGDPVQFAVLSDTQQQWEGVNRLEALGDAIAADSSAPSFDFILHAGDLVESPSRPYWDYWFTSFEKMLLVAPFIPVLGNHEKNGRSYYDAFPHPPGAGENDERWWALHWGDVVVVGLDTSASRADRILEQQAWAEQELSGPERHKFVIFHHPVYSSDAYHGSGYGYEKIYHPIFVKTGVDVVLNGHAHNYERIVKDGITYLVLGGGGAVPRELAPKRVDGSVVAVEGHNFYARVSTTRKGISVDVVSIAEASETTFTLTSNELLDSFFLPCESERPSIPWATLAV
ncbi:MAG: metallophosphoesterase, partial [Candidatus Bipolaricaulota bacterium]|nr:metallophosphoesterase [Candidatus Bipolaricaulota bacterium]